MIDATLEIHLNLRVIDKSVAAKILREIADRLINAPDSISWGVRDTLYPSKNAPESDYCGTLEVVGTWDRRDD